MKTLKNKETLISHFIYGFQSLVLSLENKNQSGQVIILLLLVIVVSLSVGLSIATRSLTEVSTSTKIENSSRALFAAEAGLEKGLSVQSSGANNLTIGEAKVSVNTEFLPKANQALEFPPIVKERTIQTWLIDPNPTRGDLITRAREYSGNTVDIYFGNTPPPSNNANYPALAATLIFRKVSTNQILQKRFFIDANTVGRVPSNNFTTCSNLNASIAETTTGRNREFLCKHTLDFINGGVVSQVANNFAAGDVPLLIRMRLLYTAERESHRVAVAPCSNCSLPSQARIIKSTGQSGDTSRSLELFRLDYMVPQIFDYAIFSVGDITK